MDVPKDTDISDFEREGDHESGIDESNRDSDESDNSTCPFDSTFYELYYNKP